MHEKNPINQVENYKKSILKSELINSVYLAEKFLEDYYGCIETVVYFHIASKDKALAFCNNKDTHTKIWTREDIEYIKDIQNVSIPKYYTYALAWEHSKFNDKGLLEELVKELSKYLAYADYNYERKQPYTLKQIQKDLVKPVFGAARRWNGVA